MALPWLIGAAVVSIGAAIAKSVSDDNDRKAEAQRRAEREQEQARKERAAEAQRRAAQERVRKEREQRLRSARENFLLRGERIGSDIAQSLQGWIEVKYMKTPAFVAELQPTDPLFKINNANNNKFEELIPIKGRTFDDARRSLDFYSNAYAVIFQKGANLTKSINEISEIEKELKEISQLKEKISNIKTKVFQNV